MTSLLPFPTVPAPADRPHWCGEPVTEVFAPLGAIAAHIPTFDRVPFGVSPRFDMIVRRAQIKSRAPMPTGIVSKRYVLVQHVTVLTALINALHVLEIPSADLRCRLLISESGARMALRVQLPGTFAFTPPDGHRMALTFECFNSVDRTVPLFALLGWFRFVCSNGLVVGATQVHLRQQHRPSLQIGDLEPVLTQGMADATADRDALAALMEKSVSEAAIRTWVEGPVAQAWGPIAAARVYAIAMTGTDGEPCRTPRYAQPHERAITRPTKVPGAEVPCANAYGLSQALAWIAARRKNIAEQLAWRRQIAELVAQVRTT